MKKVAIIGAGVYGLMIAKELENDFEVTVYEKDEPFCGASKINQARIHMGYHYPRDIETAKKCKEMYYKFLERFPEVCVQIDNHYCIAKGSKVNREQYIKFMDEVGLPYKEIQPDVTGFTGEVEAVFNVPELIFDWRLLRNNLNRFCKVKDVKHIELSSNGYIIDGYHYDYVINCTYSNINEFILNRKKYQHELCQIPIIKIPNPKFGFAIMDGKYCGLIPFGKSDEVMVYDVDLSVVETHIGPNPVFSKVTESVPFEKFREKIKRYYPEIENAELLYVLFTTRMVLPDREEADARPYEIIREENILSIFSSKISFSIECAEKVKEMLK